MMAINGSNLPWIDTYAKAVSFYEQATPQGDGWRALHTKRDTSKRVRMDDGVVKFRFHHTDLVEYRSPTEILIRPWDSVSSGIFIYRLSPFMPSSSRCGMRINGMQPAHSIIRFTHNGDQWKPDLSTVLQEHRFEIVRGPAGPHTQWAKRFWKMHDAAMLLMGKRPSLSTNTLDSHGHIEFVQRYAHRTDDEWFAQAHKEAAGDWRAIRRPQLLRAAAVLDGRVVRRPLPIGEMPPKSVYDPFAWFLRDAAII